MQKESQILLLATLLVVTAMAASSYHAEVMNLLTAVFAGAVLNWVMRKPD